MKRKLLIAIPVVLIVITLGMMYWYNNEPDLFDPVERARAYALEHNHADVTGSTTTSALLEVVDVMLNKRGGYLSNDIMPPWLFLDNVPNWEFGVLTQVRDLARILRNDFSRSQTQSTEDPDLSRADPLFHYTSDRWLLPTTEGKYTEGMEYLERYSPEQKRRHDVRPGLTGWAQINGRNAISWPDRFKLDVWYVDNLSFWLDVKIFLLTIKVVVTRKDISQPGRATIEKFVGN